MENIAYRLGSNTDLPAIVSLLEESQLVVSDLSENQIIFILAFSGNTLIGCIGLECYGSQALLRSFAVTASFRSHNIGSQLFNYAISYLYQHSCEKVHLLTTTAKDYFERKGFVVTDRNAAPPEIAKTKEFADLCPVSSSYMVFDNLTATNLQQTVVIK